VARHEGYLNVGLYEDGTPGELFITMAKEGSTVGGMMDAFATAISLCLQYGVPLEALVKKFSHQRFEPTGMTTNLDIPFAKSIVDYIFRWLGLTFIEGYREANVPKRLGEGDRDAEVGPRPTSARAPQPSAAPEAVKEDIPSEPGRADQASRTEVGGPGGALPVSGYAPVADAKDSGGNGDGDGTQPAVKNAVDTQTQRLDRSGRLQPLDRPDLPYAHFDPDAPPCGKCGAIMVRNGTCYVCRSCGTTSGCS